MVYLTLPMADQKISHTWMTKIQETIEGDEKRTALFTWPRVKFTNKLQFTGEDKRRFLYAHLFRDLHNTWWIPIVSDESKLTSEAAAAQNTITVNATDERHFYNGRDCILISLTDWESYEVVTMTTVSGTQITTSSGLANTWPVDTNIYPLYECRIESEQSRSSKYWKINSIDIVAKESFEETRTFTYTLPTVDTDVFPLYNSKNLFLYRPLNPVTEKYRHPNILLGEYGKQFNFSTYGDTRAVFDRRFICNSRKEIYDLFDFFDAKQGRFKTFYTPTWMKDIIIASDFNTVDTTLAVNNLYLTADEVVGRHIYIKFKDGTYACREITARPSANSITISPAIGTTVPTADLPNTLCSFLYEVRFNMDEILFEYETKSIAKTKLSFNIL